MYKIVAERRNGLGFRGGAAETGAGFLTDCRTGRIHSLFPISPAVPRGIFGDMLAADLLTASRTADHLIVTAGGGAGAGNFVFAGCRCWAMSAGDGDFVCAQFSCALTVTEAFLAAGTGPVFPVAVFRAGFFL